MKIVATMLCGNNESIVGDAIRSVAPWIDEFHLIDTGISDGSIGVARDLLGDQLQTHHLPWTNDFAAARNFALSVVARGEPCWALTIDTDERLQIDGFEDKQTLKDFLAADDDVLAWMVKAADQSYGKERFIRVPSDLRWEGKTHEALVGSRSHDRTVLPNSSFWEIEKSPQQFRAKLERDLGILREETGAHPDNARWWYYLGRTHRQLGDVWGAIDAYKRCSDIKSGWPEQAAWACYEGASCLLEVSEFRSAIEMACYGMSKNPNFPELAWIAGLASYRSGNMNDAIVWSKLAVRLGHFEGIGAGDTRISFRALKAWYEAPYDVLRYAYRQLDDVVNAEIHERKFHAAREMRLGTIGDQSIENENTDDDDRPAITISSSSSLETKPLLLLLSHMRSYSTLLGHILGSHPDICGYYEHQRSYGARDDIIRTQHRLSSEPGFEQSTLLFDKLLHNHEVNQELVRDGSIRLIVSVREPRSAIASVLRMARRYPVKARPEFADQRRVTQIYVQRLRWLRSFVDSLHHDFIFFPAEELIVSTDQLLSRLAAELGLSSGLSSEYQLFHYSGKAFYGDPSPAILHRRVITESESLEDELVADDLLDLAREDYEQTLIVLDQASCSV